MKTTPHHDACVLGGWVDMLQSSIHNLKLKHGLRPRPSSHTNHPSEFEPELDEQEHAHARLASERQQYLCLALHLEFTCNALEASTRPWPLLDSGLGIDSTWVPAWV